MDSCHGDGSSLLVPLKVKSQQIPSLVRRALRTRYLMGIYFVELLLLVVNCVVVSVGQLVHHLKGIFLNPC